jgi:hypothetical protein
MLEYAVAHKEQQFAVLASTGHMTILALEYSSLNVLIG